MSSTPSEMEPVRKIHAVQRLHMQAISLNDLLTDPFRQPGQPNQQGQLMENSLRLSVVNGRKILEVQRQYEDPSLNPPQVTEQLTATLPEGFFEVTKWSGHSLHTATNLSRLTNNNEAYSRGMLLISSSKLI